MKSPMMTKLDRVVIEYDEAKRICIGLAKELRKVAIDVCVARILVYVEESMRDGVQRHTMRNGIEWILKDLLRGIEQEINSE